MARKAKDDAKRENVTEDTIRQHFEAIETLKGKAETANSHVRNAYKAAERDGVNRAMLRQVASDKRRDPDDVARDRQDYDRYTSILNEPAWAKLEELEYPPEPADETRAKVAEFDAGQQGVNAGRAGHPRESNPFEAGSVAHAAFDRGWIQGDETRQALGADPAKPARRGRPRKDANGAAEAPATA